MLDRVKKILGLTSRKTGNKLVVSVEKLERRVALLENGRLEEYSVERSDSRQIVGSVYKGRVKNIEMGLKAMFVDIGLDKNGFLHVDEIVLFSGDGDFRCLVESLQRRGVRVTVISTISSNPPMVADELRRQADLFIDLMDLRSKFGRDPSDRPPPRAPRHVPQFLQGQKHSLIDDEEIDVDGR